MLRRLRKANTGPKSCFTSFCNPGQLFCSVQGSLYHSEYQPCMKTLQEIKESLALTISHSCSSLKRVLQVHTQATIYGIYSNHYIRSLLITGYALFHDLDAAHRVFNDGLFEPRKTLVWNTFIRACLENHHSRLVIDLYHDMIASLECMPDARTFHLVIRACTDLSDFEVGGKIYSHARAVGIEFNILVGTALISMYSKAGDLQTARFIFDGMPERDIVSWNALLSGFASFGSLHNAMSLFREMRGVHGMALSEATIVSLVSACGNSHSHYCGDAVHAYVVKAGFGLHQIVCNTLIEMYSKLGCLRSSTVVFEALRVKDCVSWSTIIGGYVHNGRPGDALKLFDQMLLSEKDVRLTKPILLNSILACANKGDMLQGRQIHKKFIIGSDRLESDVILTTALIYMYSKCGEMMASFNLLNSINEEKEDVIVWNALVKACTERKEVVETLTVLQEMLKRGVLPNDNTFSLLISLFSSLPLLYKGMEVHACIVKRGFESETSLANALVHMYGKCGRYGDSYTVFLHILDKNVVSWSSIIQSGAWNGQEMEAISLFELMMEKGIEPNHATFVAALSACGQARLVDKGLEIFKNIREKHGLEPTLEEISCMVNLFSRAGLLIEAYRLAETSDMDDSRSAALWSTVLSACRLCGDWVIGEAVAHKLFCLEPENVANYLMLAQIYNLAGRPVKANHILSVIRTPKRVHPGYSFIDYVGSAG